MVRYKEAAIKGDIFHQNSDCMFRSPFIIQFVDGWMDGSINQYINISIYQYINISIYQYINISIYQYINISIYQYINISIYQYINISIYQYINISIYQYINISIRFKKITRASSRNSWQARKITSNFKIMAVQYRHLK